MIRIIKQVIITEIIYILFIYLFYKIRIKVNEYMLKLLEDDKK